MKTPCDEPIIMLDEKGNEKRFTNVHMQKITVDMKMKCVETVVD